MKAQLQQKENNHRSVNKISETIKTVIRVIKHAIIDYASICDKCFIFEL